MLFILLCYLFILLVFGIYDFSKVKTSETYILAGKKRGVFAISFSLIASVCGASATLGVVSLATKEGFIAFWWLASGSVGFLLASFFLSKFYYSNQAKSLPDLIEKYLGKEIKVFSSYSIALGWVGIVAAQLSAAGKIVAYWTPLNYEVGLMIISFVIIAYSFMGGITSGIKIDGLQTFLIFLGLGGTLFFLFKNSVPKFEVSDFNIFDTKENISTWVYFLIVVGSGYFIGPDIANRLLTAKSESVIKKSLFIACFLLAGFSLIVTFIGAWIRKSGVDLFGADPLLYVVAIYVPEWFKYIVVVALFSAVISSADTCLMTVSSIVSNNIFKSEKMVILRSVTFVMGLIAFIIAIFVKDIISLLIFAYNVFNGGLIMPIAVAIFAKKKFTLNRIFIYIAITVGGALGILSSVFDLKLLATAGAVLSLLISIFAVIFGKKVENIDKKSI